MDDLIEDNICELICLAYGDRYENKADVDKCTIKTYAQSILEYVRNEIVKNERVKRRDWR